jgi:hypothetical protein
VKTVAVRKFNWAGLLGCCLALWLAGCAPRIYETPYVPPPLPAPPPPPAVSRPVYYVSASRLNLRGCAGMDCPKISVLEQNEAVEKLGEMDDWFEVIVTRDGRRGWVTSRYLSPEPVAPTPEAPPAVEAPPPAPETLPAQPPAVEKPTPVKPPVVEKPKPAKPEVAPPKKKTEEARPAKPGEPARKPAPPPEKAAPPKEKPAPPEKPTPPKAPESEQPKSIRIM